MSAGKGNPVVKGGWQPNPVRRPHLGPTIYDAVMVEVDRPWRWEYLAVAPHVANMLRKKGRDVVKVVCPHTLKQVDEMRYGFGGTRSSKLFIHIPNSMGATKRVVRYVMVIYPFATITVSLHSYAERICRRYSSVLWVCRLPVGQPRKWTAEIVEAVRYWVHDCRKKLGTVCRKLNAYGIWISVEGLLHHHWYEIKPPPKVLVW